MKDQFKLENQYQLYLQKMQLSEAEMHPEQKKQLKQTFFGACGQMLIMLRDDVAELSEDEGMEVMDSILNEVIHFFLAETNTQN